MLQTDHVNLKVLMRNTIGTPNIIVGIIDGPVVANHDGFEYRNTYSLTSVDTLQCRLNDSAACGHGTFTAGILHGKRSSQAPGICPGCTLFVNPIFCEELEPGQCPPVTRDELTDLIRDTINQGARIVNLSLGVRDKRIGNKHRGLNEVAELAMKKGVLLIVASGNHRGIGLPTLFDHPWPISAVASDGNFQPLTTANLGHHTGRYGLMAPGKRIESLSASGGYTIMSGTSVAAPFIAGTAALLWSLFPNARGGDIRNALLGNRLSRRGIVPPMLDAQASWQTLKKSQNAR